MKRNYIACIHKENSSDYGVSFPDFPGCITAGSTVDEAKDMAEEVLQFHIDGLLEDGIDLPNSLSLEDCQTTDAFLYFLVSVSIPEKKSIRINVTFTEPLLKSIDREVQKKGMSRSGWLASVAKKSIAS